MKSPRDHCTAPKWSPAEVVNLVVHIAEYDRKGEGIADLDISRIQYHDTTGQRAQTNSSEITYGSQ